jgi:hypothetical protein
MCGYGHAQHVKPRWTILLQHPVGGGGAGRDEEGHGLARDGARGAGRGSGRVAGESFCDASTPSGARGGEFGRDCEALRSRISSAVALSSVSPPPTPWVWEAPPTPWVWEAPPTPWVWEAPPTVWEAPEHASGLWVGEDCGTTSGVAVGGTTSALAVRGTSAVTMGGAVAEVGPIVRGLPDPWGTMEGDGTGEAAATMAASTVAVVVVARQLQQPEADAEAAGAEAGAEAGAMEVEAEVEGAEAEEVEVEVEEAVEVGEEEAEKEAEEEAVALAEAAEEDGEGPIRTTSPHTSGARRAMASLPALQPPSLPAIDAAAGGAGLLLLSIEPSGALLVLSGATALVVNGPASRAAASGPSTVSLAPTSV